jgi:F-type H+-transporting ATPase subunit gamma
MKMVAGARLRRAEQAILALRPFSSRLDRLSGRFIQGAIGSESPFFVERDVQAYAMLVVCSDRGLCGAYNNRVIAAAQQQMAQRPGHDVKLIVVGKRGIDRFGALGVEVHESYQEVFDPLRFVTAQDIGNELQRLFLHEQVDEVLAVFTEFFSPLRQHMVTRRLLPCDPKTYPQMIQDHYDRETPEGIMAEPRIVEEADTAVTLYEPAYASIGRRLLEENINVQVYRALLEAQASEHGARMMAMDNATENAEEMIEELTLQMNRLRQESITKEILDVVGGAEALS